MNVQQSYREASVQGATPVELVLRLYEQMIEDLRQVSQAIEKKDIKLRTNRIKHAILIVAHLQSTLDFAQGGKVARDLDNFYNLLRQNLVQLQCHPSEPGVAQLIAGLMAVREAWVVVDRTERHSAAPATGAAAAGPGADRLSADHPSEDHVPMHWNG